MELSILKQYLIASIQKNGNQHLTLQHLVNIISLIEKHKGANEQQLQNTLNETMADHYRYGVGD